MIRIRNLLNGDIRTKWRRDFYDAGYGPFVPFGALGGDPSPVINWDFLQSQSLTSFSRTSNATLFDSTGKLTYAANNLLLNSATLSTQTVTTGLQAGVSVILSFSGTGSVAISGGYTGSLAGTGVSDRVSLKFTTTTNSLTFTVTGSVTSAQLEAVTYQTTPSTYTATTSSQYYGPRYPYAYNGSTWDAQGLLVEAAATNLLSYSEAFDNGVWKRDAISPPTGVTPNAVISPDGTQNADLIYPGSSATQAGSLYRATTTGTVVSVYAKAAGFNYLCLWNVAGSTGAAWFNLSNGTLGTVVAGYTATIINAGNGWYRCSLRKDDNTAFVYVQVQAASADNSTTPTASGTNGIYIYGAQFETGDQATSYIPNLATGTTTRNADTSLAFSAISLPTGLSFSRASNAMQYDAAGRLTYAPNNLLSGSQSQFNNTSYWSKVTAGLSTAATITDNYAQAPDGTMTASRLQIPNIGGTSGSYYAGIGRSITATTSIASLYVKSTSGSTQYIQIGNGNAPLQTVTSSWTRVNYVFASGTTEFQILLYGPTSGNIGTDILIWGAQLEAVTYETLPRPYNATTTSAYYGPRYDYDPLTRLPKGLLIEEGRTNICLQSNAFTTTWLNAASTIATATIVAPDGTSNSWLLTNNTTVYGSVYQSVSTSGSTTYTFAVYAKANAANYITLEARNSGSVYDFKYTLTGSGTATINGSAVDSPTGSITYVGNGWYRCVLTKTVTSTTLFIVGFGDAPVAASSTYIYGASCEAGSFPTSYIPTTSASGIRSADIATLTGTALTTLQGSAGTVVTEFNCSVFPGGYFQLVAIGTAGYAFSYVSAARKGASNPSSTLDIVTANTATAGVDNRVGVSFLSSGAASVSLNGGSAVAGTGASFSPTTVYLGSQSSSNFLDGYIRKLAIWNVKLSDAKLVQKSTVGATF